MKKYFVLTCAAIPLLFVVNADAAWESPLDDQNFVYSEACVRESFNRAVETKQARVKQAFSKRIIKSTKGLVQITMLFSQAIETTPGVVAHIYRLFARSKINIRDTLQCFVRC